MSTIFPARGPSARIYGRTIGGRLNRHFSTTKSGTAQFSFDAGHPPECNEGRVGSNGSLNADGTINTFTTTQTGTIYGLLPGNSTTAGTDTYGRPSGGAGPSPQPADLRGGPRAQAMARPRSTAVDISNNVLGTKRLRSSPGCDAGTGRKKMAAATLLVLCMIAAGCGNPGRAGITVPPGTGGVPTSPWLSLHKLALPALPTWVHHKFRSECRQWGCSEDAVAVDANGNILVAVGEKDGECCFLYGLVRFDSHQRRWLPGGIVNPKVREPGSCFGRCLMLPVSLLPAGRALWMIDANSGSVYRARLSDGWSTARRVVRATPRGPWGFVNALTRARRGRVWVVGSTSASCPWFGSTDRVTLCGRSLIGLAGGGSRRVRAIHVPGRGSATDAAVGPGGSLWLLVPRARRCRHGSCRRSALIRDDPTKRRFARYMIPARLWPDIGQLDGSNSGWVYPEPGGTVWVAALTNRGVRVIGLHHGSFSSRIVRFPGSVGPSRPAMDGNGDIWFCDSSAQTVTVLDARTGKRTTFQNRYGTSLLEDPHGGVWYVKGDGNLWSTC